MATFDMFTQSFAAYKMKLKCLMQDPKMNLDIYMYIIKSCFFVTRRKINASSLIKIKVKNDKERTSGIENMFGIKL